MAILKGIGKPSCKAKASKDVLDYVGNKATLTEGLFCSSDYKEAYHDFQNTKEFYDKENGRQFLHYVQSFKEGEVTGEQALELTRKFCEETFKENEVFLAVHTDTKNIHCHIVVNSVSFENGYKFQCSKKDLENWKERSNLINKEHGLEIPYKSKEEGKIIVWEKNKYKAMKNIIEKGDIPDNVNLVRELQNVMKKSESKEEFIDTLEKKGYSVKWQENNKNITFTVPKELLKGKKNKFRLSTLAKDFNQENFSKEGLENEFKRNREERGFSQEWLESRGLGASGRDEKTERRNQQARKGNDVIDGSNERFHNKGGKDKYRVIFPTKKDREKERGNER